MISIIKINMAIDMIIIIVSAEIEVGHIFATPTMTWATK